MPAKRSKKNRLKAIPQPLTLEEIAVNVWDRNQFDSLFKPLVYYFEKNDGEILYIGSSGAGLRRVLIVTPRGPNGWAEGRTIAFEQAERVRIVMFQTEAEARGFERTEIIKRSPRYNRCMLARRKRKNTAFYSVVEAILRKG